MSERFVSRAGLKLEGALAAFGLSVENLTAADLGSNVGGFVDCLLQRGAAKVYAVDTAYGVLAWTLRKHPRVVVVERTNALHVRLPEPVDLVSIDVGWTRQEKILPHAATLLKPKAAGGILTLIKPHYESDAARKQGGVLNAAESEAVLETTRATIEGLGFVIKGTVKSPIEGRKGNVEYMAWVEQPTNFETRP